MSIPPNSPWRGCAAFLRQPVSETDELAAQFSVETTYYFNGYLPDSPLPDIVYRSSSGEQDILRHVFRWDRTPYQEVFQNGFQARRQQGTSDEIYHSLDHYVHNGGRPLDSTPPTTHPFVSTTLNSAWHPTVPTQMEVYRYEIYAPGGIWVAATLGDRYKFPSQDEVCFVAGIAPQYIRSAQLFRLTVNGRFTRRERVNNTILLNGRFNPQSHPYRLLNIQRPVSDRVDENGRRVPLSMTIYIHRPAADRVDETGSSVPLNTTIYQPPAPQREALPEDANLNIQRLVTDRVDETGSRVGALSITMYEPPATQREHLQVPSHDATDWYANRVANIGTYIDAAFRSSSRNEAYVFMKNEYVLLNYAPGSKDDRVVNGPHPICDGYPSLAGTAFGEHGIDCAFASHRRTEAFIFSGNLCARIDYAPGTKNDKILKGPMTIAAMFPFFKRTVFESGVDAAFESSAANEAYIFKGDRYALINYGSDARLIATRPITHGFYSLRGTIFEDGIDAAFASHNYKEAYLFKRDSYALINFAPGSTDDYIIGGVKQILPNWPSLRGVLPRSNRGLDVHDHAAPEPYRGHDEL